ncbi:melibiose:sodium transporter MelB [Photobacterium sp. DNB23_23_1]|uniref:Melibiose:sodium transporter MelB n=1 Tax=Photobacterium pectinilyticum TaxID=2906793 RepID=A0ABT1N2L1_9GAMM|nr:melibiose:sodium transporter MelB [Photobacterium sp. ZSDE20]MCQ1058109.1 melibiose:sodium transporter MelB [Photobacterium sp. ZSDE20]MDD1822642.1 melibiose:sodium transporter MelB [Photobacterium sp. ZSDE20]
MKNISIKEKVSYGIGSIGANYACAIIYIYLMFYYTDVVGISTAFIGTLFLIVRVIDAITDPIMGMIVDNTKSRFGKFRPWILVGTLVNSVMLIAVFSAHLVDGWLLYGYVFVTYILWGISFTILDIPFWSILPALTKVRSDREKVVVWVRVAASIAWMTTGAYGLTVISKLGEGDQGNGFLVSAFIIVALFVICSFIMVKNVKEAYTPESQFKKFTVKDVIGIIKHNDQLKALIGTVLTFNIAGQLISGFAIYYFTYGLNKPHLFPIFMLVSGFAEILGIVSFPYLSTLFSRRIMWFLACFFPIGCFGVLFISSVFSPESVILVGAAGFMFRLGNGFGNGLSTVMLADVVDYGEYKTGRRSESIIFSVQTMLVKFSAAFAGFFIGIGLSIVGYVPNIEQSESAIVGIKILMLLLPAILMTLSAIVYKKYYLMKDGFDPESLPDSNNKEIVVVS